MIPQKGGGEMSQLTALAIFYNTPFLVEFRLRQAKSVVA
jgi:hypothetical protein